MQGEENKRGTLAENTRDLCLRWFPLGLVPDQPGLPRFFPFFFFLFNLICKPPPLFLRFFFFFIFVSFVPSFSVLLFSRRSVLLDRSPLHANVRTSASPCERVFLLDRRRVSLAVGLVSGNPDAEEGLIFNLSRRETFSSQIATFPQFQV